MNIARMAAVRSVNAYQRSAGQSGECSVLALGTNLVYFIGGNLVIESVLITSRTYVRVCNRTDQLRGMCSYFSGMVCLAVQSADKSNSLIVVNLHGEVCWRKQLPSQQQILAVRFIDEGVVACLAVQAGRYCVGAVVLAGSKRTSFRELCRQDRLVRVCGMNDGNWHLLFEGALVVVKDTCESTIFEFPPNQRPVDCYADGELVVMLNKQSVSVRIGCNPELTHDFRQECTPCSLFRTRSGFGVIDGQQIALTLFRVAPNQLRLVGEFSVEAPSTAIIDAVHASEDGRHYAITSKYTGPKQEGSELFVLSLSSESFGTPTLEHESKLIQWSGSGLKSSRSLLASSRHADKLYCCQSTHLFIYRFTEEGFTFLHRHKLPCTPLSLSIHPTGLFVVCSFKSFLGIYAICDTELVEVRTLQRPNAFVAFLTRGELLVSYSMGTSHLMEIYQSIFSLQSVAIPLNPKHQVEQVKDFSDGMLLVRTVDSIYMLNRHNGQRSELHVRISFVACWYHEPTENLFCLLSTGQLKYCKHKSDHLNDVSFSSQVAIQGRISCVQLQEATQRLFLGTSAGEVLVVDARVFCQQKIDKPVECLVLEATNSRIRAIFNSGTSLVAIGQPCVIWEIDVKGVPNYANKKPCQDDVAYLLQDVVFQTKRQLKETKSGLKNTELWQNFGKRGWQELAIETSEQYERWKQYDADQFRNISRTCWQHSLDVHALCLDRRKDKEEELRSAKRTHEQRTSLDRQLREKEMIGVYNEHTALQNCKDRLIKDFQMELGACTIEHEQLTEDVRKELEDCISRQKVVLVELRKLIDARRLQNTCLGEMFEEERQYFVRKRLSDFQEIYSDQLKTGQQLVAIQAKFPRPQPNRSFCLLLQKNRLSEQITEEQQKQKKLAADISQLREKLNKAKKVAAACREKSHLSVDQPQGDRFCILAAIRGDIQQSIFKLQEVVPVLSRYMKDIEQELSASRLNSKHRTLFLDQLRLQIKEVECVEAKRKRQADFLARCMRQILQKCRNTINQEDGVEPLPLKMLRDEVGRLSRQFSAVSAVARLSDGEQTGIANEQRKRTLRQNHKITQHLEWMLEHKQQQHKRLKRSISKNQQQVETKLSCHQSTNASLLKECRLLKVGVQQKKKYLQNRQAKLQLSLLNSMQREDKIINESSNVAPDEVAQKLSANLSIKKSLQAWEQVKKQNGRRTILSRQSINKGNGEPSGLQKKLSKIQQESRKNVPSTKQPFDELLLEKKENPTTHGSPSLDRSRSRQSLRRPINSQPQTRRCSTSNIKSRSSSLSTMHGRSRHLSSMQGQCSLFKRTLSQDLSSIDPSTKPPPAPPVPHQLPSAAHKLFRRMTIVRTSLRGICFKQEA